MIRDKATARIDPVRQELDAVREELEAAQNAAEVLRERISFLQTSLDEAHRQLALLRDTWLSPEEASRRDQATESVVERLTQVIARDADEVARARKLEVELKAERQSRAALEQMVSFRLVLRAKALWDRFPRLKNAVKSLVKKLV